MNAMDAFSLPPIDGEAVFREWSRPQRSIVRLLMPEYWTVSTSTSSVDAWSGDVALSPDGNHSGDMVATVRFLAKQPWPRPVDRRKG